MVATLRNTECGPKELIAGMLERAAAFALATFERGDIFSYLQCKLALIKIA
jgi:hypothetical protein